MLAVGAVTAVGAAEDRDAIFVYPLTVHQPAATVGDVALFAAAPVAADGVFELAPAPRRTAIVRLENGVAAGDQKLGEFVERLGGLCVRSAVYHHDRGSCGRLGVGTGSLSGVVQQSADGPVAGFVGDVLGTDERCRVDVPVFRVEENVVLVRFEVVCEESLSLVGRRLREDDAAVREERTLDSVGDGGHALREV